MIRILAAAFAALLATAASAEEFTYDHNGSTVSVEERGGRVTIRYERPRSVVARNGVRPGTVLFQGQRDGGVVDGMAWMFSSACGPIDYYVSGEWRPGGAFTLRGAAPVRDKGTCRIVDNTYEGGNANLGFRPVAARPGPLPEPQPQAQAGCVQKVRPGSGLNMRVGPGTEYGIVAEIPHGTCGVEVSSTCRGVWCAAETGDGAMFGWVHTGFIAR